MVMVSLGTGDVVDARAEEVVDVLRVVGGGVVVATLEEVEEGLAGQDFAGGVEAPGQGLNWPTTTSGEGTG